MNMHRTQDLLSQVANKSVQLEQVSNCEHCGEPFTPREGSGGKAQRFCSPEHRAEYHAQRRQRNGPHVGASDQSTGEVAGADKDAPTPAQMREMLIRAGKAFDEKFPQQTVEDAADRVMADMARDGSMCAGFDVKDFDWQAECIVVPEQLRTAAYFNEDGDFVIRQEKTWDREEDSLIFIAKANIDAFIDKLTDALGIPSAGR